MLDSSAIIQNQYCGKMKATFVKGCVPLEEMFEYLCAHIESNKAAESQGCPFCSATELNENEIMAVGGYLELPLAKPKADLLIRPV